MHPTILNAIRNRQEFDIELNGKNLHAMKVTRTTHDGHSWVSYSVSYNHHTILRHDDASGFVQYRWAIDDATFASDFAYNRAIETNAISDKIATALGI